MTVAGAPGMLTRFRVALVAAILLATTLCVTVAQFCGARDNVLPAGTPLGGDFVAFHAAAQAAAGGDAQAPYDQARFESMLREAGPPRDRYGLTWQYPPTYYFVVLPLAFVGFASGYFLWSGLSALALFSALRWLGLSGLALFVILSAPSTAHAFTTGQNGFITAALLAVAALLPERRPILAGLAAALLTVKPQLGLLIPIAYAAGGCWRAFGVASAGAVLLAAASYAAFGASTWLAFFGGLQQVTGNLAAGLMPLYKMGTPYAAAQLAGLNPMAALALFGVVAGASAGLVAIVWRRVKDTELRALALLGAVFLAAPYAFYYEFVILAVPLALVARRGAERGWLPYEQWSLLLLYFLPALLPGEPLRKGLSLTTVIVVLAAAVIYRRIAHEAKADLPLAAPRLHARAV